MSLLRGLLLFSVVVVRGTEGRVCTRDLDFINPARWPVLRNLASPLRNARFVNVGILHNVFEQAVVQTWGRQTYLYGDRSLYGTGNNCVRELVEIRGRDIKDIQFGSNFLVALEYGGRIWTAGYNYHGQLSKDTRSRATFTRVHLPRRVKEIAIGASHCAVLTTDGQLFSWGFGPLLGYITHSAFNPIPRSFTLGTGVSRPSKICCGWHVCAALTQHSEVYSWGSYNQIGRTGNRLVPGPVMGIPSNQVIIKLSCGQRHTVAVSSSGHLYGWGENHFGELLSETRSGATHATVLALRVIDAVAGRYLTVVRYQSGTSAFFGRYNGVDYRTATPTTSLSPRDLMAHSLTCSTTGGTVRLCG